MNTEVSKSFSSFAICYILYFFNVIHANTQDLKTINLSKLEGKLISRNINFETGTTVVNIINTAEQVGIPEKDKDKRENIENTTKNNPKDNLRKPVKLTMKQGLILNQVILTYALSETKSSLCRNHTEEFKIGLRALEPWALQMFDSSSKLTSGILNGNLVEYGAYSQCLNIYKDTEYGPLRGRHCGFRVTPTVKLLKTILSFRNVSNRRFELLKRSVMDGVKLVWSVCVPDSCHSEDVFPHFNKSIAELTEGLGLVVSLREEHCNSLADEPAFDVGDYLVMSFIGIVVLAVFAASLIDYRNQGKSSQLISILSAYSNGKRLFSTTSTPGELECLHGLRYISICYVVTGHRYIHNMVFPTANAVDFIYWIQQYFSTLVIGGTVSVDTFFLIGSILVSYNFFRMVEKTKKISLIQFYLYRNLRLTMPLIVVVAIYSTLLKHFGSGPTWYDYSTAFQKPCQYFWWSTLLHLQSYVNPETMCIVQTWYLTSDVLFYYFSPIIMIPLWKFPTFGFINWIVIYILSIISSFWVAWSNQFDGAMPITSRLLETKYFQKHYIVPHTRASPYIIGLAFGYALFKTRGERIQISPIVSTLGWIFCMFCLTSVVMLSHIFHVENYEYNRLFSSLFLSCSRSVWTVGLMWIIFCCVNGNAGVLAIILSHPLMKILGRTVYSILLLHYVFQSSMQASRKTPQYFSDSTSIYMACADILLMTVLGIPFTLCFEYPSLGLASLLLRTSGDTRKVKPAKMGGDWTHIDK